MAAPVATSMAPEEQRRGQHRCLDAVARCGFVYSFYQPDLSERPALDQRQRERVAPGMHACVTRACAKHRQLEPGPRVWCNERVGYGEWQEVLAGWPCQVDAERPVRPRLP